MKKKGEGSKNEVTIPQRIPPTLFQNSSQTFSLHSLLNDVVRSALKKFSQFQYTLEQNNVTDKERKKILFTFFATLREKLIRILVLVKFSHQKKDFKYFQKIDKQINDVVFAYNRVSETLYNGIMLNVGKMKEPKYDIPSSIEILSSQSYNKLPKIIERSNDIMRYDEKNEILEKNKFLMQLSDFICMKILKEKLPRNIKIEKYDYNICISANKIELSPKCGKVKLIYPNEFELSLTLDDEMRWKIIKLKILVNEVGVTISPVNENIINKTIYVCQKYIDTRNQNDNNVLEGVLKILHEISLKIALDIFAIQAKLEKKSKFKGIIICDMPWDEKNDKFSLNVSYWHLEKELFNGDNAHEYFKRNGEGYHGQLHIVIDDDDKLKVEHFPALPRDRTKMYNMNLSKIDFSEILFFHFIEFMKVRLRHLSDHIVNGEYYDDEKITFFIWDNFPAIIVELFEDIELLITVNWKNGLFELRYMKNRSFISYLDNAVINYLQTNKFERKINLDLNSISRVIHEGKKEALLFSYKHSCEVLGYENYDEKYYVKISKFNPKEVDTMVRNKFLYIKFPNLQMTTFFGIYFSTNEEKKIDTNLILLLPQEDRYSFLKIRPIKFSAAPPDLKVIENEKFSRKRKLDVAFDDDDEEEEEEGEDESPQKKKQKFSENVKMAEKRKHFFHTLTHLKYLINTYRFIVFKNCLYQQVKSRIYAIKNIDHNNQGSIQFTHLIAERKAPSFMTIQNDCSWTVFCVLFNLKIEKTKLDVFPHIKFEKMADNDANVKVTFSYSGDEYFSNFLKDSTWIGGMLLLALKFENSLRKKEISQKVMKQMNLKCFLVEFGDGYTCELEWEVERKRVELKIVPENELTQFLERFLNIEGDITKFVGALNISVRILIKLKKIIEKKCTPFFWTIVPRNLARIRLSHLFYKSDFWVNFAHNGLSISSHDGGFRRNVPLGKEDEALNALVDHVKGDVTNAKKTPILIE